jgi:hypothetical protein
LPKNSCQSRVKIANKVSLKFDKRFTQNIGAMNRGAISDPSFIGSLERPPMKNEATPKNAKGLIGKTSDERRGNHKKRKGAHLKDRQ